MLFKTAYLARREALAVHDLAKLRPCLESQLRKALGGASLAPAKIAPLRVKAPSVAGAFRIVTGLKGASVRIYLDLLVERDGRGLVETALLSLGMPPPADVEQRAAAVSARRLARYAA
jgi:hypothetical protein